MLVPPDHRDLLELDLTELTYGDDRRTRSPPAISTRKQWGVAVQSKFLAVGSVVPWAEPGVGAIATQAYANPRYGPDGLALLREGLTAKRSSPGSSRRRGARRAAARRRRRDGGHARCMDRPRVHGLGRSPHGRGYAAQGNILVGAETVDALAETFEATRGAPARRAPARVPRRCAGSGRRPPRPAVRRASRRRARRRVRAALRRRRRPARRRPRSARSRSSDGSTGCTSGCSATTPRERVAAARGRLRSRGARPPRATRLRRRSTHGPAWRTSRSASTGTTRIDPVVLEAMREESA